MGQYYYAAILEENGTLNKISPSAYGYGLKLMEHAYIDAEIVDAVLSWIWRSPAKIAWVGDYADSPYEDAYSRKMDKEKFMLIYNALWGECAQNGIRPQLTNKLTFRMKNRFLVNHTQKRYIDLGRYMRENSYMEIWHQNGKPVDRRECIHPLPLLTACDNDRGGGDFHKGNPGYELVGTWALDLIEYTDRKPGAGFEEQVVYFSENRS